MGLEHRPAGMLRNEAPLEGQNALSIEGQAMEHDIKTKPDGVPIAATGLLRDRRDREDVKRLRKQQPTVRMFCVLDR